MGDFKSPFIFILDDALFPETCSDDVLETFGPIMGDVGELKSFDSYSYDHVVHLGDIAQVYGLRSLTTEYGAFEPDMGVQHIKASEVEDCLALLDDHGRCIEADPNAFADMLTRDVRRRASIPITPDHVHPAYLESSRRTLTKLLSFALSGEDILFLWQASRPRGCVPGDYGPAQAFITRHQDLYPTSTVSDVYKSFNYIKALRPWLTEAQDAGSGLVVILW